MSPTDEKPTDELKKLHERLVKLLTPRPTDIAVEDVRHAFLATAKHLAESQVPQEFAKAAQAAKTWSALLSGANVSDQNTARQMGLESSEVDLYRKIQGSWRPLDTRSTLIAADIGTWWELHFEIGKYEFDHKAVCSCHPREALRMFHDDSFSQALRNAHEWFTTGPLAELSFLWWVTDAEGGAPYGFGGASAFPAAYALLCDYALEKSSDFARGRMILANGDRDDLTTPAGFAKKLDAAAKAAADGRLKHLVVVEEGDLMRAEAELKKTGGLKITCLATEREVTL